MDSSPNLANMKQKPKINGTTRISHSSLILRKSQLKVQKSFAKDNQVVVITNSDEVNMED